MIRGVDHTDRSRRSIADREWTARIRIGAGQRARGVNLNPIDTVIEP